MNFKTKIDDFGRIVIPKKIRDELGIKKDSRVSLISKEKGDNNKDRKYR